MSFIQKSNELLNKSLKSPIRLLILVLCGVLTGLTTAFPVVGFLEWVSIIPVAIILFSRSADEKIKLRSLYLDGFVFFYGYYLVSYHYFLSMYPLDFIDGVTKGTALAVVAISWLGLAWLQGVMGAFVFLLSGVAFRGRLCQRISLLKPFCVAALWAAFEWSQNFGWWGIPWGKLALGQTKYILGIQNASWLGCYFITFVLVAVNFLLALALLNLTKKKIFKASLITAVSILAFQYASGALIWFTTDIEEGETIKISCVQGNVSASNKWTSETMNQIMTAYSEQTLKAAKEGAEIIVWPETAIPYDITDARYKKYADVCANLAKETDTYIIVGAYSTENDKCYNSLICFSPDGEIFDPKYHKRRLVPFGEFVPLRGFFEKAIPPLTEILITFDDTYMGESANIMNIEDSNIGCLICFDSIYDGLTFDTVRNGAEVICLSTNDSWFSGSRAFQMHNSHAQLRAVESGRYITRSASTGISTIISPRGEVLAELGEDTEGIITYDVYKRQNKTVWHYIGNLFVYLCLAFVGGVFVEKIIYCLLNAIKKQKST